MKNIRKSFVDGSFILDLKARSLRSVFHQVLNFMAAREKLPREPESREEVEQALLAREAQSSSAIGHSVAVPHAYLDVVSEPTIVFVRLARPLNLGALDGIPVRFVFVLLGPPPTAAAHLDTLASIARLMSDDEFRYEAGESRSGKALLEALEHFLARAAPPPEHEEKKEVSDGLRYTGRLAGGILADIRRRLAHYKSDFRDGIHSKCLGSILFLYFACLAPAITFGGLMTEDTGGYIGAVEMIVATAVCGVVYALVAGQPLIILGGTGPLLIFTFVLFDLCRDLGIPPMPTYAWVGFWTCLILVILALTDASALMRYFTRFTDEIFAALISLIFIYEAIKQLAEVFVEAYQTDTVSHDRAFLSLILAFGTFLIAMNLSRFRRSRYLQHSMREFLADFGPTIALVIMTGIAYWFRDEVSVGVLAVPDRVGPTSEGRSWLINPFDPELPKIVWLAAAIPGLFAAILIYLDQNISARLINSPDHKLQKGEAYHLDLLIVGVLVGVCSLFGLPWLVAATVRSLNHVRSLASVEEVVTQGGQTRERIVHVRENRVTALAIHLLIGLSLLLLPLLKLIPVAVLLGIFLYMGVVSIKGNQFFERMNLWPMDPLLYPSTHYIRRVPLRVIHLFTLLQLACLVVLWLVKAGSAMVAILFPLVIAMLVPVRMTAGRFFDSQHLAALDADEEPDEEETHWGGG